MITTKKLSSIHKVTVCAGTRSEHQNALGGPVVRPHHLIFYLCGARNALEAIRTTMKLCPQEFSEADRFDHRRFTKYIVVSDWELISVTREDQVPTGVDLVFFDDDAGRRDPSVPIVGWSSAP